MIIDARREQAGRKTGGGEMDDLTNTHRNRIRFRLLLSPFNRSINDKTAVGFDSLESVFCVRMQGSKYPPAVINRRLQNEGGLPSPVPHAKDQKYPLATLTTIVTYNCNNQLLRQWTSERAKTENKHFHSTHSSSCHTQSF